MARTILAGHLTTRIDDAREGRITKVEGVVVADELVFTAPMSGNRCVHFHTRVVRSKRDRDKDKKKVVVTLVRERQSVDFLLRDARSVALVRMDDALVVTVKDVVGKYGVGEEPRLDALLRAHGRKLESAEVTEGSIDIGERVAVVGVAHWIERPHYRGISRILELSAPPEHPLIVSDDPETFTPDAPHVGART